MRLLLDTHALLWWLADDDRLGPGARDLIGDPGNDVLVSTVSLWEIVMKVRVGKLEADSKEIVDAIRQQGFVLLDIGVAHLLTLEGLPVHHRDPFDHLLIAQAIVEDAIFVSEDRNTPQYPVRFIACSGAPSSLTGAVPGLRKGHSRRTEDGSAKLVCDLVEYRHRYRIARTPVGFLVTARTRDAAGLFLLSEWVHRTEEAAIACMEAVAACNAAMDAISSGAPSAERLIAFQAAIQRHNEICERLGDPPQGGRGIRNLGERLFPE